MAGVRFTLLISLLEASKERLLVPEAMKQSGLNTPCRVACTGAGYLLLYGFGRDYQALSPVCIGFGRVAGDGCHEPLESR